MRLARQDPSAFAIAVDPAIDRLRDGARTALRRKVANALFVVAAVEALPSELDGRADEITVNFPWGTLLRGIVGAEAYVLDPLARLARPDTRVRALLSVEPRDGASGLAALDAEGFAAQSEAYRRAGFALEHCRVASRDEIAASGSSWAKRLGERRCVFALELRRKALPYDK